MSINLSELYRKIINASFDFCVHIETGKAVFHDNIPFDVSPTMDSTLR